MLEIKESLVKVNFMHPTTMSGTFKYPPHTDEDTVEIEFVFAGPITPPIPRSGGRLYILPEWQSLETSYKKYKDAHF